MEDKIDVEGLDYAAIDAIRLEAFRTNDPATKQRFLEAAGRWFQYETIRALDRYYALTAQQAEIERLRGERDAWKAIAEALSKSAEDAQSYAKGWADADGGLDVCEIEYRADYDPATAALAAYVKLKEAE